MNQKEIFAFLQANPLFHLATTDGNQPHVRGMLLYRGDENGIIFHTGKMKDLHKQLSDNPKVELCFNNYQDNIQVRIAGTAELVEDLELKKEIVASPGREFLKPWIEQMGYEPFAVYRLKNGRAVIWTMEANFSPKSWINL